MSGKLDWSERCSWGNQPPTHASLRPSSSEKLVACTEKQIDTHIHITNTFAGLRKISFGGEGLLRGGEGVAYNATDLSGKFSQGDSILQVWPQAYIYIYI